MSTASLVLTVIGADRPGLVEALSKTIADHGASWLESRMAHLAGHFVGLLRVSVADARAAELIDALRALEARGLRVIVEPALGEGPDRTAPRLRLELVGLDRPGIVREISSAIAERGVNVEELESHTSSAPMSGETLFHASAWLRLPHDGATAGLRAALEKLANEMMVELSLDHAPGT
ncbi:MAG: glycine cleavage system protein R [Myxococcota bacterium]